jgi:DNA replication licensing factor MCM5
MSSPSAGGSGGSNPFGVQFTPEEEEEFGEMARSEGFYERFAKSVGPSIYGSLGMHTQRFVHGTLINSGEH